MHLSTQLNGLKPGAFVKSLIKRLPFQLCFVSRADPIPQARSAEASKSTLPPAAIRPIQVRETHRPDLLGLRLLADSYIGAPAELRAQSEGVP
jgi:hypothetical protein